jgi:hypothetical protein
MCPRHTRIKTSCILWFLGLPKVFFTSHLFSLFFPFINFVSALYCVCVNSLQGTWQMRGNLFSQVLAFSSDLNRGPCSFWSLPGWTTHDYRPKSSAMPVWECFVCATVHSNDLCQKAGSHRANGWYVIFCHASSECGTPTGDYFPPSGWYEKCSASEGGQETAWRRIAHQILPCCHPAMWRGGLSLDDNYRIIGIYFSLPWLPLFFLLRIYPSLLCPVDAWLPFFNIKTHLSYFTAPSERLVANFFIKNLF